MLKSAISGAQVYDRVAKASGRAPLHRLEHFKAKMLVGMKGQENLGTRALKAGKPEKMKAHDAARLKRHEAFDAVYDETDRRKKASAFNAFSMPDIKSIRKVAAALAEHDRSCFNAVVSSHEPRVSSLDALKLASVEDPELLKIAQCLPGDALELYEKLGGKYKSAFGVPVFQPPKMPAAPAVGTGAVSPPAAQVSSPPDVGNGSAAL
jgi:hypothetical protein